eukprot:418891_1
MPKISFVSEIAKARRSFPILERCERPSVRLSSFPMSYPGCFLQGPEENSGLAGLTAGAALIILIAPKRAKAAGAALLLSKIRLEANDATVDGKRIIIDLKRLRIESFMTVAIKFSSSKESSLIHWLVG